ncbi:MAG TPA: response regulator [Arcobacter sp.]|jgi:DNA-binding NtrC family response regulator|nr:response regulator [Arcobacter sp.]
MYNIAIVDDELDILKLLERFLQRDFNVTTFSNPVNAYNEIIQSKFDLVLCDIMMPQMDGIELLEKVRQNNNTKFIMITAFDTIERALKAHKLGASNYIKKPFGSLNDVKQLILSELQ